MRCRKNCQAKFGGVLCSFLKKKSLKPKDRVSILSNAAYPHSMPRSIGQSSVLLFKAKGAKTEKQRQWPEGAAAWETNSTRTYARMAGEMPLICLPMRTWVSHVKKRAVLEQTATGVLRSKNRPRPITGVVGTMVPYPMDGSPEESRRYTCDLLPSAWLHTQ